MESKASDFLEPEGKLEQAIRILARGKAEPDFRRAFTTICRFDDKEWLILSKSRGDAK